MVVATTSLKGTIYILTEWLNTYITGNIAANNGWNIDGAGAAKAPYSGIRLDSNCDNNQIKETKRMCDLRKEPVQTFLL
jgi:hypothetical protein